MMKLVPAPSGPPQTTVTCRSASSVSVTPLASFWSLPNQLMVDVAIVVLPPGLMHRNPPKYELEVVFVTVTFAVTAVAPGGTTLDWRTAPDPSRASLIDMVRFEPVARTPGAGAVARESYARNGVIAWKVPAEAGPASLRHLALSPASSKVLNQRSPPSTLNSPVIPPSPGGPDSELSINISGVPASKTAARPLAVEPAQRPMP